MTFRITLIIIVIILGFLVIIPFVLNIAGVRVFQFGSVGSGGNGGATGGLLRSPDGGITWEGAGFSEDKTAFPREILDFVFHPSEEETLFIGAKSSGLWKSENTGVSWRRVLDDTGILANTGVYAIRFGRSDPSSLYLAVFKNRRGRVFKSEDSGKNFREVYFVTADGFGVFDMWVNPFNPREARIVTGQGGILETLNGGATWRVVKWFTEALTEIHVNPAFSNEMFVVTSGGKLFKTFDGGNNWSDLQPGFQRTQAEFSPPSGVSVNPFGAFLQGRSFLEAFVSDPSNFARLYIGSGSGLFRSADGGFTWRRLDSLIPPEAMPVRAVAINPQNSSVIFAGVGNELHRSEDNGESWSVSALPTSSRIEELLIHPKKPEIMFAILGR